MVIKPTQGLMMQYPMKLFQRWQIDNRENFHVPPQEDDVSDSFTILDSENGPRSVCLLNSDDLSKEPEQLDASSQKALEMFNGVLTAFQTVFEQTKSDEERNPENEQGQLSSSDFVCSNTV